MRRAGERPSLPFATPSVTAAGAPLAEKRPSNPNLAAPNLAMTLIGPVPITPDAVPPVPLVPPAPPGTPTMPAMAIPSVAMSPSPSAVMHAMPMPMPPMPPMPSGPVPVAMPPGPSAPMPLAPSGLPALVADDISQVGATPLVNDPKLGWNTSIQLSAAHDGSSTRLASEQVDFRLQSNTRWVILAVLLAFVVVAMLVLIVAT